MDFYEVLSARRSYRAYRQDAVPEEALARISNAVRLAPTACNRQPVRILLLRNAALKAEVCKVYSASWLAEAPVIAVLLGNESEAWKRLEGDSIVNVDAAIVMEHFVLAAAAEGLGTCWICAYQRAVLDALLPLENGWKTIALSPLGYANGAARELTRKDVSELVKVID